MCSPRLADQRVDREGYQGLYEAESREMSQVCNLDFTLSEASMAGSEVVGQFELRRSNLP